MARVLVLSFEGVIVDPSLQEKLYSRFAGTAASELAGELSNGRLTPEEYHSRVMTTVEAGEKELRDFVRDAGFLRPGTEDLFRRARELGWIPIVLSDGPQFVADQILASAGIRDLPRHGGRATRHYRWQVRYLTPRGIEVTAGFKLSYVRAFRSAGDFVAFAGTQATDAMAAQGASAVLAGAALRETLGDASVAGTAESPLDIIEQLERGFVDPASGQVSG